MRDINQHAITYFVTFYIFRLEDLRAARGQDRETIERQNQQLSEYEAEINVLRRRIETLENDRERDKKEIARLTEALNRARVVRETLYFDIILVIK